jgi:hypothetical protein
MPIDFVCVRASVRNFKIQIISTMVLTSSIQCLQALWRKHSEALFLSPSGRVGLQRGGLSHPGSKEHCLGHSIV